MSFHHFCVIGLTDIILMYLNNLHELSHYLFKTYSFFSGDRYALDHVCENNHKKLIILFLQNKYLNLHVDGFDSANLSIYALKKYINDNINKKDRKILKLFLEYKKSCSIYCDECCVFCCDLKCNNYFYLN